MCSHVVSPILVVSSLYLWLCGDGPGRPADALSRSIVADNLVTRTFDALDFRAMLGSTGMPGNSAARVSWVRSPANNGYFTLSGGTTLSVAPPSGTVGSGATTVPFTFGWTDTATTGSRRHHYPRRPNHDRQHHRDRQRRSDRTAAALRQRDRSRQRRQPGPDHGGRRAAESIYSGSNPAIDDGHERPRVDVTRNSLTDPTATVTIAYAKTNTTAVFNGLGQSAPLSLTFAAVGNYDTIGSPINLAGGATPLVTNGEAAYVQRLTPSPFPTTWTPSNNGPLPWSTRAQLQRPLKRHRRDRPGCHFDRRESGVRHERHRGRRRLYARRADRPVTEVDSVIHRYPPDGHIHGLRLRRHVHGLRLYHQGHRERQVARRHRRAGVGGRYEAYRGLSVGYTANVGFATADANPSGLTDFSTATTLTSFVAPGTAMKNLELTVASGGKAVGMAADVITTPRVV